MILIDYLHLQPNQKLWQPLLRYFPPHCSIMTIGPGKIIFLSIFVTWFGEIEETIHFKNKLGHPISLQNSLSEDHTLKWMHLLHGISLMDV